MGRSLVESATRAHSRYNSLTFGAGSPTRIVALAAVSGGLGWSAHAEAQQAELDREWAERPAVREPRTTLAAERPGRGRTGRRGRALEPRRGRLLRRRTAAWLPFRARGGGLGPAQVLEHRVEPSGTPWPVGANSSALAVCFDIGSGRCGSAGLAPGTRTFSVPKTLAEDARTGYPSVAMDERGDAALLYRTEDGPWLRRRPGGRRPGAAEFVAAGTTGWPSVAQRRSGRRRGGRLSGPRPACGARRARRRWPESYRARSTRRIRLIFFAVGMDAGRNAVAASGGSTATQVGRCRSRSSRATRPTSARLGIRGSARWGSTSGISWSTTPGS